MGVLVYKGVLKVMCLVLLVLVMTSMTVCEFASLGPLILLYPGGLMPGRRGGCRVLWSPQKCRK